MYAAAYFEDLLPVIIIAKKMIVVRAVHIIGCIWMICVNFSDVGEST